MFCERVKSLTWCWTRIKCIWLATVLLTNNFYGARTISLYYFMLMYKHLRMKTDIHFILENFSKFPEHFNGNNCCHTALALTSCPDLAEFSAECRDSISPSIIAASRHSWRSLKPFTCRGYCPNISVFSNFLPVELHTYNRHKQRSTDNE